MRGAKFETAAAYANQAFVKPTIANWGDAALSDYAVGFICDLGAPNFFVPLSEALVARKLEHVMGAFASQHGRGWFSADTFRALMRLRGVECNAPDGYAEAFYARKLVLEPRSRAPRR